jgi:SNF family Na+-dependent transporter
MAERKRAPATSRLEWLMAAVGALIALGLLGFIGWEAVTGANGGPAVLVARTERVVPTAGGFVAERGRRRG